MALFLLLIAGTAAFAAPSAKPSIQELTATEAHGKVSVHFALESAFRDGETVEALQSGIPVTFTYFVEIFRDRPNWFDDGIEAVRIEVICTYNSLTREYLVNYRRDRHLVWSETLTDPLLLQKRMTTVDEHDLFDIGDRKPHKLKVRVRASLARGWLMYVIPWEVGTKWREVRVKPVKP